MPTMRELVDTAQDEWGEVAENIGNVVPFGQKLIDQSLIGVPVERGALFILQGITGARKTTAVINFIVNQLLSGRLPQGYHIAYDTLESGMSVERIRDIFWSILATKYLVYWHHHNSEERDLVKLLGHELPKLPIATLLNSVVEPGTRNVETKIRPEAFKYFYRTKRQHLAIQMAGNILRNWPLMVFGPSEHPDEETRKKRTTETWFLGKSAQRWKQLHDEYNVRQIVIDHAHEYLFEDNPTDYELQKRVVPIIESWQKYTLGVVWLLAQVGIGSAREARQYGIDLYASGGWGGQRASSLTWTVEYDMDDPYFVKLKRPVKSRLGVHPDLAIKLEPNSGAFIGQAVLWGDREL